jgi:hypothetical protein
MAMFETLQRTMQPRDRLKIRCDACGHQVDWSKAEALDRMGSDAAPFDIRRRLVCSLCGGPAQIWV